MKRILVNIVIYAGKVPNLAELLPHETEVVNKWKVQGILENLFFKQDRTGVYLNSPQISSLEFKSSFN